MFIHVIQDLKVPYIVFVEALCNKLGCPLGTSAKHPFNSLCKFDTNIKPLREGRATPAKLRARHHLVEWKEATTTHAAFPTHIVDPQATFTSFFILLKALALRASAGDCLFIFT